MDWEQYWKERRHEPPTRAHDVRSAWERDYARIIHSAAFRRLQSKTQVIDLGQSDFYRTRLTHSMEVAQVSNGLVKHLARRSHGNDAMSQALPDFHLLAAICLAHDLGHPPYGHGGEAALNFCMRDFGGFEGNGQTLRILASLEQYTQHHGLNATRRLLLGILKYPAPYSRLVNEAAYGKKDRVPRWLFQTKHNFAPKCYMDTEQDVVDWMLEPLPAQDRQDFCAITPQEGHRGSVSEARHSKTVHMSLDASIMCLADDISYALHDLEDAVAMGMLTREMWEEFVADKEGIFENCGCTSQGVADDIFSSAEYRRKGRIGGLVHHMIVHSFVTESGLESVCPLIAYTARLDDNAAAFQKMMGTLVYDYVITGPNVQMMEFRGRKIVVDLFDVFATDPLRLLPVDVRKRYQAQASESAQMRVVCDHIAAMSDAGAARLHDKLFHAGKGSIFDKL